MQKFQINLGKTLPAFRGEWDKDTQYDYNDIVTRYESSYVYQKKGSSANKDPYLNPTYEDEHGEEKLYWGLLAGRGVKGAKWYVGSGAINLVDRQSENDQQYYTIDDIDTATGAEVSEIAQVGDYYLDTLHGVIYMCVYPGGGDENGAEQEEINDVALWRYATDFNWLESYKYFFINTADIDNANKIIKYYRDEHYTQSGTELIEVDLTESGNELNISNSRFNCYLYGTVGTSESDIPPISPIIPQANVSWNRIIELNFNEQEISVSIEDGFTLPVDIWILVEQFSIEQTTSSFTFNTMQVAAVSKEWDEEASVSTSYVEVEGVSRPLMTFGIPRGKPLTIVKVYNTVPIEEPGFEKYAVVLGLTTSSVPIEQEGEQQEVEKTSYHFYYNNGNGPEENADWVDMGIFDYTLQLRYDNVLAYDDDPTVDNHGWKSRQDTNFPYMFSKKLDNLQELMIPYVVLDEETAAKGNISPVADIVDSEEGVVLRIYAAKIPTSPIVLKTVVCTLPPYIEESGEQSGS